MFYACRQAPARCLPQFQAVIRRGPERLVISVSPPLGALACALVYWRAGARGQDLDCQQQSTAGRHCGLPLSGTVSTYRKASTAMRSLRGFDAMAVTCNWPIPRRSALSLAPYSPTEDFFFRLGVEGDWGRS